MARALAILLVASLLLAAAPAAAEPGKGRGRIPVGAFQVEEGSRAATGEHLSFTYNDTGVLDFRASNRTLFDLHVEGEAPERGRAPAREGGVRVHGSELRVQTPSYSFTAHDAPTAASKLRTDGDIRIVFEEGVVLAREAGDRVRFSFGDVTGVLRGEELVTAGREVTAREELLVLLDKPRGAADQAHYRDLGRAIARGHVGAEATLNLHEDDDIVESVVSYGNVNVTKMRAERGNITLAIEGHGFEGRVVVLNVDGRILGADRSDQLQVLLDNASIRQASNLTDILDPDDDGYQPEYYVVFDPAAEAFQLILTVPHYSVHILSVTTPFVLPPPSVTLGLLAGLALLVPTALVLFRRR